MSLPTKPGVFNPATDFPFFVLSSQNHVPSAEDKTKIQELLIEKTAHLSHLNLQVPKRQPGKKHKVPHELRADLAYTRRFLDFHRAVISPWRRLPIEILSEIFLFTLEVRGGTHDGPWVDDRAGTLLLCRICSAWRCVCVEVAPSGTGSHRLTFLATSQFSIDSFPVVNLTDLCLADPIPMPRLFQIFEQVLNLETVAFRVHGPAVACSTRALLGMKSVLKLKISYNPGELLERTEFPNIVELGLSQSLSHWADTEFHSFRSRSFRTLTTLGFCGCNITQEKIIASLQHNACNALKAFYVKECVPSTADALLQYLTYRGSDRPLSNPKLNAVKLHDIHTSDGLLSTTVESRLFTTSFSSSEPAPTRLRNVSFSFADEMNQEIDHSED
ncbi:hypothetical protein C8R45DRAFT_1209831 [Mycena sanguinolenta]|nr:hypothetical protein C8R45DRAFT_1209831 [Mycena sanguinolenta]